MKLQFKNIRSGGLQWQRNILAGLSTVLLIIALLQAVLLFFRNTRIVFLPPEVRQEFWVQGNSFSPSYLEEQGMYFAHLLLDVSPATILTQGEVLLRYIDSRDYGEFSKRLLAEEQRLKRDNLSLSFAVNECEVFPKDLIVELKGDLHSYVAGKKIASHRETYRLEFSSYKGRLFLRKFTVIESDQKGDKDAPASTYNHG